MLGAFSAASIVQAIRGFPPSIFMFLRGIPFEPPRAGMTASTFTATLHGPALTSRGAQHQASTHESEKR